MFDTCVYAKVEGKLEPSPDMILDSNTAAEFLNRISRNYL